MKNTSTWFYTQLTSSAEAFVWAMEQIPEERWFISPPDKLGEWPAARHVFHLLSYERRLALPNMRFWLGETFERDNEYQEEVEWAREHSLKKLLEDFRKIRTEEISLLKQYREEDWEKALTSPVWEDIPLRWVVTKTLQHTFEHTHNLLAMTLFWDHFADQANDDK